LSSPARQPAVVPPWASCAHARAKSVSLPTCKHFADSGDVQQRARALDARLSHAVHVRPCSICVSIRSRSFLDSAGGFQTRPCVQGIIQCRLRLVVSSSNSVSAPTNGLDVVIGEVTKKVPRFAQAATPRAGGFASLLRDAFSRAGYQCPNTHAAVSKRPSAGCQVVP